MRTLNAATSKLESDLNKAKGLDKLKSDSEKAGKSSQSTAKNVSALSGSTTKFERDAEGAAKSVRKMAGEMDSAKRSGTGLLQTIKNGMSFGGGPGGLFGGGILPGLSNISQIIQGIPQIGQLAGAIIRPLTDAAEEGVRLNMTLETAELAFTQVAGSAEKAHEHLMKLQVFGAASPFRFEGLLAGARLMTTFGFQIDEQIPKLKVWGNAIAAGGEITEDKVHRVVVAMGQMRMAGKVNSQDMLQLTNANIPGWQLLAKAIGKTVAETRKLAENGKLNGKVAVEAITAMMAIDKRFEGMMDKLQSTTSGRLSALQDAVQIAQGTATQGLTQNFSKVMQDALDRPELLPMLAAQINAILTPVSGLIETGVKTILTPGITTGIVEGIRLGKDMVKSALVDFAQDSIIGSIKGVLGINSPSKVFMEMGENSAEGFRDGLLAGIRGMTGDMISGFDEMLDELENHLQSKQKRFASTKQRSKENLDKLIQREPDFLSKLIAGAQKRGMNPDHILNVMAVETAGSFNPFVRNPTSSASGMIQFMRDTAPTLGTTIEQIRKMNATQQLEYVFKYFDQYIKRFGPLDTQGKVYSAVGTGMVKPNDDDVVMRRGQRGYAGNAPTWDRNMDGLIRQSEMAQAAIAKLGAGIDFTVNGQPITAANPVPVFIANAISGTNDNRIGGWRSPPRRGAPAQRGVDPAFTNLMPPVDTSGTVMIEPDLVSTSFSPAVLSKMTLNLRPLTPMLIESSAAAAKLAEELKKAGDATGALGPGQWYEAATAIGSMQQRLSEFFDTLPENRRFMEDTFISLPERFGDIMGDSFLRAEPGVKSFFREIEQQGIDMARNIGAELLRQLTRRFTTQLMIHILGRPEMDSETGEATGKIVGGWEWLTKLFGGSSSSAKPAVGGSGSALAGALNLPKRAFGGPVFAGQAVLVGDHPSGRANPEIFVPQTSGQIVPLNQTQAAQQAITRVFFVDDERAAFERGATRRELARVTKRMRKAGKLVGV